MYILGGKNDQQLRDAYVAAMRGMRTHLLAQTGSSAVGGRTYLRTSSTSTIARDIAAAANSTRQSSTSRYAFWDSSRMENLACFVPGMLALGHMHGIDSGAGAPSAACSARVVNVQCLVVTAAHSLRARQMSACNSSACACLHLNDGLA